MLHDLDSENFLSSFSHMHTRWWEGEISVKGQINNSSRKFFIVRFMLNVERG